MEDLKETAQIITLKQEMHMRVSCVKVACFIGPTMAFVIITATTLPLEQTQWHKSHWFLKNERTVTGMMDRAQWQSGNTQWVPKHTTILSLLLFSSLMPSLVLFWSIVLPVGFLCKGKGRISHVITAASYSVTAHPCWRQVLRCFPSIY